eukprot:TRINITY_DN9002_c0_g6_i1.p1 TRINITY_DN9002_c0_g6~~TRINITY_DN9002_c0_g6_i1.p1  ORF type:complete len:259 (+),score=54.32 TRINITY_DN9002_c0_g6_i1:669-1445(+)
MALLNHSDEVLFLSYMVGGTAPEERVGLSAGSFQDFNCDTFFKAAVNCCISVENSKGNVIQYLSHPLDTAQDYVVTRAADGHLHIHRVFKCSLKKNERPFQLYLRHSLAISEYSSYYEELNASDALHTAALHMREGDPVFLPDVEDFVRCKNCMIETTRVRKHASLQLVQRLRELELEKRMIQSELDKSKKSAADRMAASLQAVRRQRELEPEKSMRQSELELDKSKKSVVDRMANSSMSLIRQKEELRRESKSCILM